MQEATHDSVCWQTLEARTLPPCYPPGARPQLQSRL